ncbi:ECM1 protein, partial [Polyodon spathula]|nr:ECM1 protein [Polyodon spathula]
MEALQQFCLEESSIKTRQYHCCLKQGEEKWGCFQNDAPNPGYNPTVSEVEGAQGGAQKSEGAPMLRFSWNPQFCNRLVWGRGKQTTKPSYTRRSCR